MAGEHTGTESVAAGDTEAGIPRGKKDPKPGKRLILLLDGTWNDDELNPADTNIVRLRERIADYLRIKDNQKSAAMRAAESKDKRLTSHSVDGVEHLVFYERGVGTGRFLNEIVGGAFGEGLDDNVRRAYKFLSFYYEPGDEISCSAFHAAPTPPARW